MMPRTQVAEERGLLLDLALFRTHLLELAFELVQLGACGGFRTVDARCWRSANHASAAPAAIMRARRPGGRSWMREKSARSKVIGVLPVDLQRVGPNPGVAGDFGAAPQRFPGIDVEWLLRDLDLERRIGTQIGDKTGRRPARVWRGLPARPG